MLHRYCTLLNTMVYTHIGKWLSQVGKNIKLTYKGKQLKWRCHNDATIPKVELWFNYGIVMPTLKWFILLS